MKIRALSLAAMAMLGTFADPVIAEEVQAVPTSVEIGEAMSAFPPGAQMVELVRLYNPRDTDRISTHGMPDNWEDLGWRVEGTVGFMAFMPWGDAVPLYSCFANDGSRDYFSSRDPNCEGHFPFALPIVGWIMPYQIEGTVPLYRCDTPGYAEDHFDTTDINCESNKPGAVNEGLLGYIWM